MNYQPKQGDIILLELDPQAGHEQAGTRPVLVISNNDFHTMSKTMAMICPITNTNRNLPTEIMLDARTTTQGVIMCNQAKILDLKPRKARFLEKAPEDIVINAADTIVSIIEIIKD